MNTYQHWLHITT